MRKTRRRMREVKTLSGSVKVLSTSVGNACRLAFRELIAAGLMKNQPETSDDGFFKGVVVVNC